jgi:predicted aconitase with swiveling domain
MYSSGHKWEGLKRMGKVVIRGRGLNGGVVEGEALVTKPINFWAAYMQGILSGKPSKIEDTKHELYGKSLKGKILLFPFSVGSLAGGVSLLEAIIKGVGPKAIVNSETDGVSLAGPVFAHIFYGIDVPVVDSLDKDPSKTISNGDHLIVDGNRGTVEVIQRSPCVTCHKGLSPLLAHDTRPAHPESSQK